MAERPSDRTTGRRRTRWLEPGRPPTAGCATLPLAATSERGRFRDGLSRALRSYRLVTTVRARLRGSAPRRELGYVAGSERSRSPGRPGTSRSVRFRRAHARCPSPWLARSRSGHLPTLLNVLAPRRLGHLSAEAGQGSLLRPSRPRYLRTRPAYPGDTPYRTERSTADDDPSGRLALARLRRCRRTPAAASSRAPLARSPLFAPSSSIGVARRTSETRGIAPSPDRGPRPRKRSRSSLAFDAPHRTATRLAVASDSSVARPSACPPPYRGIRTHAP